MQEKYHKHAVKEVCFCYSNGVFVLIMKYSFVVRVIGLMNKSLLLWPGSWS